MLDDIKKRFEFPNAVVQSQHNSEREYVNIMEIFDPEACFSFNTHKAVGHLIAAILKEKVSSKKIRQASDQETDDNLPVDAPSLDVFKVRLDGDLGNLTTPALNLLWEKCCSENVALRTACCEGLVALVVEKHAELDYVLHGALNLIPSASYVYVHTYYERE